MPLAAVGRNGSCEIVAPIGTGGMGEVYRVRYPARGQRRNQSFQSAILRTRRALKPAPSLRSITNTFARVHDAGQNSLVVECSKDRRWPIGSKKALPLEEALAIARQIPDALEAAGELGIVHCDLKPANVKIKSEGTVNVLSFGLADRWNSGRAEHRFGVVW